MRVNVFTLEVRLGVLAIMSIEKLKFKLETSGSSEIKIQKSKSFFLVTIKSS